MNRMRSWLLFGRLEAYDTVVPTLSGIPVFASNCGLWLVRRRVFAEAGDPCRTRHAHAEGVGDARPGQGPGTREDIQPSR